MTSLAPLLSMRQALPSVAPGTELREGLERILRGRTGALIVLGYDETVASLCSGGFELDVEFSATRLRELAKMDGALVIDHQQRRIVRANVQLTPETSIPTSETGMRHRAAARVARQTRFPVISVSKSMNTISLYLGQERHVLEPSAHILARANQAISTLERYKSRLEEVTRTLSALEFADMVTVGDVAVVLQRQEMVLRIGSEIDGYVAELGTDGRLVSLQLDELVRGLAAERAYVLRDYVATLSLVRKAEEIISSLSSTELLDYTTLSASLGLSDPEGLGLELPVSPRGYRMLSRIPRLPPVVAESIIHTIGPLRRVLQASQEQLQTVDGVGPLRARAVYDGLGRFAKASHFDRWG